MPGTWSELFFLDEATAFAAGHRPCKLCRRERQIEFKEAWLAANRELVNGDVPSIALIDSVLHDERALRGGGKRTFQALASELRTEPSSSEGRRPWSPGRDVFSSGRSRATALRRNR
jgi:methylphosphotriester-DNA--protein-cysteine methyltransferase